jgi:1-deoxy-D-xylulose-5-phosphate reductoisomerase
VRKRIVILGSTGSIGTSALDLIERLNRMGPEPRFEVLGLAGNRRVDVLAEQVRRFRPLLACAGTEDLAARVRAEIGDQPTRVVSGSAGLREVATMAGADLVLAAIVGAAGLGPTYAALERGTTVALANKEALVMAGDLMISAARRSGALLLPVDSEHNALHQCLRGERIEEVRRVVLTASGGPFFLRPRVDFTQVTPEEALAHPTWVMGRKITIDSATLMNKALEVIEARWLYGLPGEKISVIVHPQSTIHSMVEFVDGSFICQMGAADMRHPIQYALTWPDRCATPLEPVDLAALGELKFFEPDLTRFPSLALGWKALEAGGTMPAVLNAANEIAVEAFLERRIRFSDIPRINVSVMEAHRPVAASSLDVILQADTWARAEAAEAVGPLTAAGAPHRSGGPS